MPVHRSDVVHHGDVTIPAPELRECRVVMAHGAGSSSDFLAAAFPAETLGVADCRYVDDRSGSIGPVMSGLASEATPDRPTILGGVSLGAHAAGRLLARTDLPPHVVGGLLVMPAWTGAPDSVAALTAAAAEALAALGPAGVLAELDPTDWVTPLLAAAWRSRTPADLVAELATAADQPGPELKMLTRIRVPVAVIALRDDPLHPQAVAAQWVESIDNAVLRTLGRAAPQDDLPAFGRAAGDALEEVWNRRGQSATSESSGGEDSST